MPTFYVYFPFQAHHKISCIKYVEKILQKIDVLCMMNFTVGLFYAREKLDNSHLGLWDFISSDLDF